MTDDREFTHLELAKAVSDARSHIGPSRPERHQKAEREFWDLLTAAAQKLRDTDYDGLMHVARWLDGPHASGLIPVSEDYEKELRIMVAANGDDADDYTVTNLYAKTYNDPYFQSDVKS